MRCVALSPEATFDYSVTWPRAKLLGQAIAESEWSSTPEGLAIDPLDLGREGEPCRTAARIAGGVPGMRYTLTHRVTLADDRTLTRRLEIEVAR